jgi:hypothetical protein
MKALTLHLRKATKNRLWKNCGEWNNTEIAGGSVRRMVEENVWPQFYSGLSHPNYTELTVPHTTLKSYDKISLFRVVWVVSNV